MPSIASARLRSRRGRQYYFELGLLLSLLLHLALLQWLYGSHLAPLPAAPVFNVELVSDVKRQMVSNSAAPEASEPAPDAFESEKTRRVNERQSIKRGEDGASQISPNQNQPGAQASAREQQPQKAQPAQAPQPDAPPKQAQPEQETKKVQEPREQTAPKREQFETDQKQNNELRSLLLDDAKLNDKFAEKPKPKKTQQEQVAEAARARAEPFSRPPGAGASFIGNNGSLDFLPDMPDGDLTLLNTKANQYAVFVRRVALAVFSELRGAGWEKLMMRDVNAIAKDATVLARMSLDGRLLSVQLMDPSGSNLFDDVVKIAVNKGVRDPNAPKAAAAADGTIHFIFQARSWAQVVSNPKTGLASERRWLLLGTGLE